MSIWSEVQANLQAILPILCLWAAAAVILLGDVFVWRRSGKCLNVVVAVVGILTAAGFALDRAMRIGDPIAFAGAVSTDGFAMVGALAVLLATLLATLLSATYLRNRGLDHGEFYALMLLSASGAVLMCCAADLVVLFLALELMSFGLYVLAGFAREELRSEEASIKYFLLGAFASAVLLYGVALLYGASGTTSLGGVAAALVHPEAQTAMAYAGMALLLVGLCFKAALVPFHQWAPDVYEGAPTAATAFMAGAAKVAAFMAILRVMDALLPLRDGWLPAIQILAVLSMVFGNLLAVSQTNVKRMLAYSSVAHAGYLLVAVAVIGVVRTQAVDAVLFYLFAYTFMTLGAFGVLVYLSGRVRDYQRLADLRGLAQHDPTAAYAMLFFMLSLGGVPPTMGFMAKWQIFMASIAGGQVWVAVIMALASIMAAYYYLRVVWVMFFEEPVGEPPARLAKPTAAGVSVLLAAAATLAFGIAPGLLSSITALGR